MKNTALILLTLLSIACAQGQGWKIQRPFSKFVPLWDISMDGQHGVAVGPQGLLFFTHNYGQTWTPRTLPDTVDQLRIAYVVPGTNGQVMLAADYTNLIISKDGGVTWTITYNLVKNIFTLGVLPTGEWFALGNDQGIRTSNEGLFWQPFNFPSNDITAGDFSSVQNGWINNGANLGEAQVLVTTDAGFHWSLRDTTKYVSIKAINMLNDNIGFMLASGRIYKTVDGGWHWDEFSINPSVFIQDMYIVDENTIWTTLDNGHVYYSLTGGLSWIELNPDIFSDNHGAGIFADADGHVWVSGSYVSILYSDNFGATWKDQIPYSKATLYQTHFYDEFIGVAGGEKGVLWTTLDGGINWNLVQFPKADKLNAVMMLDAESMLVGSSQGRVFYSKNEGASFDTIAIGLGNISDIYGLDHQTIVVTNEQGVIYRTDNGGQQWNIVYNNGGNPLYGLDFKNAKGWASGKNGEIVYSNNEGLNWIPKTVPGQNKFADLTFLSETEGWAVVPAKDTVFHTTDGGQNWIGIKLPYSAEWNSVTFNNPDTGWIAGGSSGSGIVFRTNNGGQSWKMDLSAGAPLKSIYDIPGTEIVYAVGVGGLIMKYTPCVGLPMIANLAGPLSPCLHDTVQYSVQSVGVDGFEWHFPELWSIYGKTDTAIVTVITGGAPGIVEVRGKNACGEITAPLSMTLSPIDPPDAHIIENSGTLFLDVEVGTFQWLLNGIPIPGANGQTFIPAEDGIYSVHVTYDSGCEVTSNEITFTIVATKNVAADKFLIYPNPAQDQIYIQAINGSNDYLGSHIAILNPDGRVVLESQLTARALDISAIPSGIYFIEIRTALDRIIKPIMVE